ncbi:MAG: prepilin peptidase, partial [Acidobacteriaceae bacterium]|nr:prepilin peptidase [Acidobacteriaceae bacterium]
VTGVVLGLALSFFPGHDGFRAALGGMLCALAVYIPLFLIRGMGAGDVKLMAAVGAIAGPANWGCIFLVTAILGGIVSAVLVVLRRRVQQTAGNMASIILLLLQGKAPAQSSPELDVKSRASLRLPHGAVIAGASILFLVYGWKI